MPSQEDMTAHIQREQETQDELRSRGIDVPGAHEVGEILQTELDLELSEHRDKHVGEYIDQTAMWIGFRNGLNGRHLSDRAIVKLMQLASQYTIYEVAALASRFKVHGISVDVRASKQSEVTMAWQVKEA